MNTDLFGYAPPRAIFKDIRNQRPSTAEEKAALCLTLGELCRKVPALGYVKGNVFVISFRANRIKTDASVTEIAALLAYMQEGTWTF